LFNTPYGVAADGLGSVFVADTYNHAIRKITSNGVVTTLAGNGKWGYANGIGTNALFDRPHGIAVDGFGNVFVADEGNDVIRKISSNGVVTTLAGVVGSNINHTLFDGRDTNACFFGPTGVAVDGLGNLYVADTYNNAIRKITPIYAPKSSNTITFTQPSARTYTNGGTFALSATAPGGVVTFSSSNTNVLTVSGSTAKIKGAGGVTITASQGGNTDYQAATSVSRSVVINKAAQTISFKPSTPISFASTKSFMLTGSSSADLPLSYASSSTNVISVSGTTATVKKTGSASLTATQAGTANYNAATPVSVSVTVK
jgi:hypothetical protein